MKNLIDQLDKQEEAKEKRKQKKSEKHFCFKCPFSRWTGIKYTCGYGAGCYMLE
ncbi:hypothetical protein [Anaerovirgula multivorans]|uniref:hypothetical protein n=1 Tax=Anaerovirgula multivorans TaxID=312168 RepID=UPI00159595D1|nr:hypothetical protein [Anaerovirgula multivorans]